MILPNYDVAMTAHSAPVKYLTAREIIALDSVSGPCVSLHVPVDRIGRGSMEARIRLKNMVAETESQMTASGYRSSTAKQILRPAREMESNEAFWQKPNDGLALFLAPEYSQSYMLNKKPTPFAKVSDGFFVRPLLSILMKPAYYVLALDQNETRLIRIENGVGTLVDLPDMPHNIEEIVGGEESTKARQMHSIGKRGTSVVSVSHGSGDRGAQVKDRLLRFAQAIDRAVCRHLTGSRSALVLAADHPIGDIYRNACHYKDLSAGTIEGCPSSLSADALASSASEIIANENYAALAALVAEFGSLESRFLASDVHEEIATAAVEGRVRALFIKDGSNGLESLSINRAIIDTLRNHGRVFEVDEEDMPTDHIMAALYRY